MHDGSLHYSYQVVADSAAARVSAVPRTLLAPNLLRSHTAREPFLLSKPVRSTRRIVYHYSPKCNEHIIINTNNNMIITFTDKVTVPTDMRREGEIGKSERAAKRFASTPTPRSALVPGSS